MIFDIDLLEKLSLAFGPSGCENNVRDIIAEYVSPYADEITFDRLGSLIAVYKGKRDEDCDCSINRLMLYAHMDEVGFMVKSIDDSGYIHPTALSVSNPLVMSARNVTVGNGSTLTNGYVGIKPAHLGGGGGSYDSLYIDIGAKEKADTEYCTIKGDYGTFRSDFVKFGNDSIKCKALNSRAGCAALCSILKSLFFSGKRLPFDVCFAFTTRSLIGASSAITAANVISPDCAISVCGCEVADIEGNDESKMIAHLGKGAVIVPADIDAMYDKEMFDISVDTATKNDIPYQIKGITVSADTEHVTRSRLGVKCAVISYPVRYMNTSCEVISASDVDNVISLTNEIMNSLVSK